MVSYTQVATKKALGAFLSTALLVTKQSVNIVCARHRLGSKMCGLSDEKTKRGIRFGARVKAFREAQGLSAIALAIELGHTRGYIKSIEGGSLQASSKFKAKFRALERRTYRKEFVNGAITSRYALPKELIIYIKPRRCVVCKRWMIAPSNQTTCDRETCKREARRRRAQRR